MREWISDHGHTAGHELSRLMDKLVPTVMDNTKDAHHQVSGQHGSLISICLSNLS
jgi:hypothetical protein